MAARMAKVLVTGGAGFIGSNLVRALLERGDDVRVLDNFSTGNRSNLEGLDVEVVEGELRSYERVHNAVDGTEVVYHLGALGSVPRSVQDPLTSSAVNVEGHAQRAAGRARRGRTARRLLVELVGVRRLRPTLPGRRGTWRSTRSRRTASPSSRPSATASRSRASTTSSRAVVVRYFNVFGPRQSPGSQYAAVIPLFITRDRRGPSRSRSTATASSGATSPTSTTSSTARYGRPTPPGVSGRIFNVAASAPSSVNEVADTIGAHPRQGGRPPARRRRARATSGTPGPTSPPPARRSAGSRTVGLEEGLRRTAEFLV